MRIAYFGYDFFVDALERLLTDGHTLVHIQTYKTDGKFTNRNDRLLEIARRGAIPVGWERPTSLDIEALRSTDAVLVMGFKYKVPVVDGVRAVNLHPTLLPEGKGPFPLPWLILGNAEHSGLTLHKLTEKMDEGPILTQTPIPVSEGETLESLCAKMQMAAGAFVGGALRDFDALWSSAVTPTREGSYWEATEADWRLPWHKGWQTVLRTVRAFGVYESEAILEGETWTVTDAVGWEADHIHEPGKVVHRMPNGMVVAARDGLVLLKNPVREHDG